MKNPILFWFGFLMVVTLTCSVPGCATKPVDIAYKAESIVIPTVNAAMGAWKDYVVAHPETPQSQRDAVKNAHNAYYAAQMKVHAALVAAVNANDQSALGEIQAAASATELDLLTLLKGFTK